MASHDIKGKTFLVTGGASGIGASSVEAFLQEGAKFVAILDIAEEKGRTLDEKLNQSHPGKVKFVKCDVSKEESVTAAFDAVVDIVKQLDVVVSNAGILNDSENGWRPTCEINLLGLISLTLKAVKHMRTDQGGAGGTVINVSSAAALVLTSAVPAYNATKAGVVHFSRSLAEGQTQSKTGVRVMTICFGRTDTSILRGISQHVEELVDPSLAQAFLDSVGEAPVWQRPESAANAIVTMFKDGANGSVWVSQNDEPAEDITATVVQAYGLLASVLK